MVRVKILMAGHSIVRNLNEYCNRRSLNFPSEIEMEIAGIGGLHVNEMAGAFDQKTIKLSPNVVILLIGGNDLTNEHYDPPKIAAEVVEYALRLKALGVNYVFVCDPLPRYGFRGSSSLKWSGMEEERYKERKDNFVHVFCSLIENVTGVGYRKLKTIRSAPPHLFYDGIHPSDDGLYRLYKEIRGVAMKVSRMASPSTM